MSNFPFNLDDDVSLPRIDDNLTDLGGEAINALRSAAFAVEANIGIGAAGTLGSIAQRLNVSINQDGTLNPSMLLSLLATLSITDAQVSPTAAIQESKIALAYSTTSLHNLFNALNNSVDIVNDFISITGMKVEPHIAGTAYNHNLSAILIDATSATEYTNRFQTNRDTLNSNTLLLDISSDLSNHERADGTAPNPAYPQTTFDTLSGQIVPSNYAHAASGIFINASNFSTIPQTEVNLQNFAEEVDILLGNSVENLFANGIIRASNSTILSQDGYAQPVVPPTPVTTHLLGQPPAGSPSTSPVDNITFGDDVITFNPSASVLANSTFDAQFAQVKPGNIITVNYGNGVAAQFAVDSVKTIISGTTRVYAVRIVGKNIYSSTTASARIDQSLFQTNKFGILSSARAAVLNSNGQNAINENETLIISNPKGAVALGIGFNPSAFDTTRFNLYLTLYPTGNPADQVIQLPAIDVTGNKGTTPGNYTLDGVINATNLAFRAPGYNYRFTAFEYEGAFGIALADSYNNAAFSIVGSSVDGYGNPVFNANLYPNNVVDGYNVIDPLGLGTGAANVASPAYAGSYITPVAANVAPTLIFYALRKNYYYVDGTERDSLKSDPSALNNIVDSFGDGYWPATITSVTIGASTIATTYSLNYNLSTSGIEIGKTIVVQPAFPITDSRYSFVDYGRFVVNGISFSGCDTSNPVTTLTVYDAVHGTGVSPYATSNNIPVNIYFSDDSVSFDAQNVSDGSAGGPFKRFFEIYVDQNGHTFTHERGRFLTSGSTISNINLSNISPKIMGYSSNSENEIQLNIVSFNSANGEFDGYLSAVGAASNFGPTISGRQGETVRFYDDTNIDYVDVIFNISDTIPTFSGQSIVIQLFPSLQLNQDFFLLATCQMNDTTQLVSNLSDARQFGNVSEKQLSDSALAFINTNARETIQNGVVRGFDLISSSTLTTTNKILFTGGLALTNGQFNAINPLTATIPLVQDNNGGSPISGVLWAVCVNQGSELQLIPLTDYNSSVNAINNPGRQLQLFNVANSKTYFVDSTTFSTLINDRKDLTVLWLVNSQVTNSTTYTLTISDARKYVTDTNANAFMTITAGDSQGNFKTLSAASNWATYNAVYQSNLVVRGEFIFSSDPGILPGLVMTGDGDTTSFTFNAPASITDVTFNNITFNINEPITIGSGCVFNNCTINVNDLATGIIINGSANGISFNGCNFTYVPNTSTGYSATNFVNSGHGLIYSSVATLENVSVKNCSFTTATSTRFPFISFEYNSLTSNTQNIHITNNMFYNTSSVDDMYAVIALTCTITTSVVTLPPPSIQPTEGLKLINCIIDNNLCDKNQMISITGAMNAISCIACSIVPIATKITNNLCGTISVIGAADNDRNYNTSTNGLAYGGNYGVTISGNSCKYIGMLSSTGQSAFQIAEFDPTDTSPVVMNTCSMMIKDNVCSWIELTPNAIPAVSGTIPYETNSTVFIENNSIRAYNTLYVTSNFNKGVLSGFVNAGISLTNGITTMTVSTQVYALIKGNTIIQGSALSSSNTIVTYDYNSSIYMGISGSIDGNIFNNIIASNASPANTQSMIVLYTNTLASLNVSILNNQFYRNSNSIPAYIDNTGGNTVNGVIANNFFDQTTVNGSSTTLISGTTSTFLIGPNKNYGLTSRSISQPMILSIPGSFTGITDGLSPVLNNTSTYLKLTKLINGATLSSVTIYYTNGNVLTSGVLFALYRSFAYSTGQVGSVTGTTASSQQNSTITTNTVIDDSTYSYSLLIDNTNAVNVTINAVVLNFTNIAYPAISNI